MEDMLNILKRWNKHQEKLRNAIDIQNYHMFQIAFRDGCRCFNELKILLESENSEQHKVKYKDDIYKTVSEWLTLADSMEKWMVDIKDKAQKISQQKVLTKKLSNAYGYMKKSGNKLRLYR